MIWIPGGSFLMGSDDHYPEEAPAHRVHLEGFWIDRAPVTNAQFQKFVKATGHITLAEQPADPSLYPQARPELLAPASIVFVPPSRPVVTADHYRWWQYIPGADWRHPEGPGSSIKGRAHHPVVHVAHGDASAYAAWAGKQLPSEAEWERAARGGLEGAEYAWGAELHPGGRSMANTFQGVFPHFNSRLDGWERTSPVGVFPANGYGLVDMIGNVWEWTDDWYADHGVTLERHKAAGGCCTLENPRGGERQASIDSSSQHGALPRRVVKGGSFLCAPSYCRRYRPAARMAQAIDTATCHMGFRCIVRPGAATASGQRLT
jgi:formylglycine-generating enzyme required for sulfatase activity